MSISRPGPYTSSERDANSPVANNDLGDRIDNSSIEYTPKSKYTAIDMDDIGGPSRMRRFSTTGLAEKDETLLSNLLEKLEHVSTSLPGSEASLEYHRKWRPLTLRPENGWVRMWVNFMHNPLLPPVQVSPQVQALPEQELVLRMTVNFGRKLLVELLGSMIGMFNTRCDCSTNYTTNTYDFIN